MISFIHALHELMHTISFIILLLLSLYIYTINFIVLKYCKKFFMIVGKKCPTVQYLIKLYFVLNTPHTMITRETRRQRTTRRVVAKPHTVLFFFINVG